MNISDSLVSHYRAIFDSFVQDLNLSIDDYILLNGILHKRWAAHKAESASLLQNPERARRRAAPLPVAAVEAVKPLVMVAAHSSHGN